jgi:hypothetical protein
MNFVIIVTTLITMRFIKFSSLLFLASVSFQAFGQGCDHEILEKGKDLGSLGYQPRVQKSRCEGLYYDNSSGVSIDLVSFTKGKVRYRLDPAEVINIQYKPEKKFGEVWIRGTSFKSRPKYRLDMPLDGKKNSAQLPVKDVLNGGLISSTDVGFFGYIVNNKEMVYFPVSTTSKFYASPESTKMYVTVLSNVDTDLVVYKYAEQTNGVCGKYSPQIKLPTPYEKLEPIQIEIKEGNAGKQLCLEVSVRAAGSDTWDDEEFSIYIPAQ